MMGGDNQAFPENVHYTTDITYLFNNISIKLYVYNYFQGSHSNPADNVYYEAELNKQKKMVDSLTNEIERLNILLANQSKDQFHQKVGHLFLTTKSHLNTTAKNKFKMHAFY